MKQWQCPYVAFDDSAEDVQNVMLHLVMPVQVLPKISASAKSCTEISVLLDLMPADGVKAQVEVRCDAQPWQRKCTSSWVAEGAITVPGLEPGVTYEVRLRLLYASGKTTAYAMPVTAATLKGSLNQVHLQ